MCELVHKFIGKKSVENGIWLYLLQIFNTVIPIMTLPYITRVLHPSEYGEVTIAINILGYFQAIVEYGFGMSATRKVALLGSHNNNNEDDINRIFSGILYSRFILFLFCFIITILYLLIGNNSDRRGMCLLILNTTLIGNVLQLNWLFQGKQDMKFISISNIVARIAVVAGIFMLVKSPDDIYLYCILTALSPIIASILGIFVARKKYRVAVIRLNFHEILDELKSGWYVFTTQLSAKVFSGIGITFLGMWSTSYEVGIYSAVQKIPYMLTLAWNPISQVLYPISSRNILNSQCEGIKFVNRIRKYTLLVFGCGAIICGILAPFVVRIAFGKGYLNGVHLIYPLLVWVILGINNNFLGIQILLGSGHDKEYSKCFQIGVICTILLNALLIYFFHSTGAAIAPMISEVILGILLCINVRCLRIRS